MGVNIYSISTSINSIGSMFKLPFGRANFPLRMGKNLHLDNDKSTDLIYPRSYLF